MVKDLTDVGFHLTIVVVKHRGVGVSMVHCGMGSLDTAFLYWSHRTVHTVPSC